MTAWRESRWTIPMSWCLTPPGGTFISGCGGNAGAARAKIETEFTSPEEADPFGAWVRNKPDSFGNAEGGIRTPGADYPVGVYSSSSKMANGKYQAMFGQVIPSPESFRRFTARWSTTGNWYPVKRMR